MNVEEIDFTPLDWMMPNNPAVSDIYAQDRFIDQDENVRLVIRKPIEREMPISDIDFFAPVIGGNIARFLGCSYNQFEFIRGPFYLIDHEERETRYLIVQDTLLPSSVKHSFNDFYEIFKKEDEGILEFCRRFNMDHNFYKIMVVDYLLGFLDRPISSLEVLETENGIELLAPIAYKNPFLQLDVCEGIYAITGNPVIQDILSMPFSLKWEGVTPANLFNDIAGIVSNEKMEELVRVIEKREKRFARK